MFFEVADKGCQSNFRVADVTQRAVARVTDEAANYQSAVVVIHAETLCRLLCVPATALAYGFPTIKSGDEDDEEKAASAGA